MQSLLVIFIVILAFSCLAGAIASKRAGSSSSDFFLAGRSISWPLLVMTLVGTQVGGGFILGTADATFQSGIIGASYSLGLSIGMLLLGLGIASRLRKLEVNTVSDIFEKIYQAPYLKQWAGVLSIISLGGILMALAISLRKFLLSLSITEDWMFLAAWISVIAYTTHGGFLAVVWTDCVQAIGMIATLLLSFVWIVIPYASEAWSGFTATSQNFSQDFDIAYLVPLVIPMLFMLIEQDMAQRAFSAKTPKDASFSCIVSAVCLFVLAIIPTAFGLVARQMNLDPQGGSVFIVLAKTLAPSWVFIAASSAVLLAILSTASSILLAVSSNAVQDIRRLSHLSPKSMTLFTGIIAGAFSYLGNDIISWMVASYEISVHTLFVPIIGALFLPKKYLTEKAALYAILFGAIGSCITFASYLQGWAAIALPLLLSLAGFGLGSLLADKSTTEDSSIEQA